MTFTYFTLFTLLPFIYKFEYIYNAYKRFWNELWSTT